MNLDLLRVFVAVVEEGNFSKAAEKVHLSQPAVSQQVQNLEQNFSCKLLHRTPKNLRLTTEGKVLFHRAKEILQLVETTKQEIDQLHHLVTGELVIGASYTVGEYVLPGMIAQFKETHPQVKIHTYIANTEEIAQLVRGHEVDIGFIEGDVYDSQLQVEPIMEDEMVLIAHPSHQRAQGGSFSLEQLRNFHWVMREKGSGTRAYSDFLLNMIDHTPKGATIFSSNQGVKEGVMAGMGVALISRWAVQRELQSGELCSLQLPASYRVTRLFSLLRTEGHDLTFAGTAFLKLVHQLCSTEYNITQKEHDHS
ncbi:LysR family transcriptional regulator [Rubeoparvulum massiliense]|uniref:LysR family transcriptional regulator n=1 Tax=Rubeoparvulum massiliense TaxID=1631346 RepID=UPI00065E2103|nr:LysR family transcriptional regulator [Rubeoparvulum massiliense]